MGLTKNGSFVARGNKVLIKSENRVIDGVSPGFDIRFPETEATLDQDQESFEFKLGGRTRRLRIHDYAEIYKIPGLYEALVYQKLRCSSPRRLVQLMSSVLWDWPEEPRDLRVFDLGAGNGRVASELRDVGCGYCVGFDLLPTARAAARRDHPLAYDDYLVADLSALSEMLVKRIKRHQLNCLVTVAALGFGDIPAAAFARAFNLTTESGWLAMTIKDRFLEDRDSEFSWLFREMINQGTIEIQAQQRYCHRRSISGERLFYVAIVARKKGHIQDELMALIHRSADSLRQDLGSGNSALLHID